MDLEYIGTPTETDTKVNGKMMSNAEMAHTILSTEVNIKEHGDLELLMDKVFSYMTEVKDLMSKCILEVGLQANIMEKEELFILMTMFIKAISTRV